MTIVVHMIILKYIKEIIFYFYKFRRKNEQSRSLWVDLYKFRVKNKIIQNVKDQNTKKKTKVAIDVPELLQCCDGERDKVTTLEKLLQRNGRDDKVNQHV